MTINLVSRDAVALLKSEGPTFIGPLSPKKSVGPKALFTLIWSKNGGGLGPSGNYLHP